MVGDSIEILYALFSEYSTITSGTYAAPVYEAHIAINKKFLSIEVLHSITFALAAPVLFHQSFQPIKCGLYNGIHSHDEGELLNGIADPLDV